MNISIQCCSIVILLWIIYLYKRSRRLPLSSNKVFQTGLFITLASLVLDVISTIGIVFSESLPAFLPEFLCKTHVASLLLVTMAAAAYVFTSIMHYLTFYKRIIIGVSILGAIEIVLIYLLPISIHYDEATNAAWISGPCTIAAYVSVFTFIIFNLVQIFYYRKHIYKRQRNVVIVWMCLWLVAAFIQYLRSDIMVVGFAAAIGIMIVFIQFENPELYLDQMTGIFNVNAYKRYVEQLYSMDGEFSVVGISFSETPWQDNLQPKRNVQESQQIYSAFLKIPGAYVFKIQDNEILLVFPKPESAQYAWSVVTSQKHMPNIEALPSHPTLYYVPNPRCVNTPREILEFLRFIGLRKINPHDGMFHVIDSQMIEQIQAERATVQMIRDALAEDRVVVYYQPIYSVDHKSFTSAEALVRIVDREGKLVPPGMFIQVAEENGLIIELGKRVFEKTCQFYKNAGLESYGVEYIEVNLSVAQCADAKLSEDYIGIMENASIEPHRINLEITESTSAQEKQTLISHMDRMISRGVNFSLDDFGSGASNLNYIMDMPVQIVKFDKEMTQAYFSSEKAKYVMEAAMHMIHGLGLEIVAEGVETEDQYSKLKDLKINYIQGYYFSKPLPEQEFLSFLRRENPEVSAQNNGDLLN